MKSQKQHGKEISLEELKVLQMDVLTVIDKFCRDNNIKYSLGCGTLLGAIRHKGYIPWDDDIDIYLLREDYEKLMNQFPESLQYIKIVSLERSPLWNRAYAQAYDTRTIMYEKRNNKIDLGVSIDIFPLDDVPNDNKTWISYNKKRLFFQRAYALKVFPININRAFGKNTLMLLAKAIMLPFSSRQIAVFLDKLAQKNNNNNNSFIFECAQGLFHKNRFPKNVFDSTIDLVFEDRIFKGMEGYDEYLSNAYGDYMKLPPKDKQIPHHYFEAYWKL